MVDPNPPAAFTTRLDTLRLPNTAFMEEIGRAHV